MTNRQTRRPLVYFAGPFRGETAYDVCRNTDSARDHAYDLSVYAAAPETGDPLFVPVIPHTMYWAFDGTHTDQYWLEATADLLLRSDAIFLCDGWQGSEGTRAEIEIAKEAAIPLFLDAADLRAWLELWGA